MTTEIMVKEEADIQETIIKPETEEIHIFHELRKVSRFKVLKQVEIN